MVSLILGAVLLVVSSGFSYVLLENDDPKESIIWPSEFYFSAEEINLKNSYVETFEVWYSGENNRSRIDYYNGTYKEYYIAETEEEEGYLYTIHPWTTETAKNVLVCISSSHSGEQPDHLPDIEGYEYSEQVELNGKQVHVWKKVKELEEENARGEATLYVYRTEYDFDIPLKKVIKMDNLANGQIEAYTITNYKRFNYLVTLEDVTYEDEQDCDSMANLKMDFQTHMSFLHPNRPGHIEKAFDSYKKHHNKKYQPKEHELRKDIFHQNWRRVLSHNSKNLGYKMELNAFADRTPEELSYLTGTRPSDPFVQGSVPFPHTDEDLLSIEVPESYDMRLEGFLGPIKNQGSCGSCWAFTTVATVEGIMSKFYGGRNLDLSEQSLVDCSWGFDNYGCNGGQLDKAYEYILKHGIPKENDYGEYLRKEGYCKLSNVSETFKIQGFAKVTPHNPTALKVALVKYGPVGVAIHASDSMRFYADGIFYDTACDDTHPNHGVVVVGYGERDGTPYWIVRNSWGEDFGMDGYILMSQINNNCFVMDTPFYPIV